ncbi:ankyrin repeat-containing domain protein [Biscogniauxia mediterranea]|nr:ankyrin repeat-containing domain protein [Biscogniauxia mediterranea]
MNSNLSLRDAVCSGDVEEVQKCLGRDGGVDQLIEGALPLTFAIRNGEEDIAIFLIENGADISLEPASEEDKDRKDVSPTSRSPLQIAWQSSIPDFILCLLSDWSQEVALSGLWSSMLRWIRWPLLQTPYVMAILTHTLFGYNMRSLVTTFLGGLRKREFASFIQITLRLVPSYSIMFLLARRNIPSKETLRSDLWTALTVLYQVPLWRLQGALLVAIQEIIWHIIVAICSQVQGKLTPKDLHGGASALEAIFSFDGGCERVANSLLDHGLFSADYVCESLRNHPEYSKEIPCWVSEKSHVRRLWTWSLDRGNYEIVAKLLELGVPPSEPSRCSHPLVHAILYKYESIAKLLLQKGDEKGDMASEDICQALIASTKFFSKSSRYETNPEIENELFYTLLHRAQHVNSSDTSGATALEYAVANGCVTAVEALVRKGANVNKTDKNGKTPLLYLRSDKSADPILRILLKAGANINHQDDEGYTILLQHARVSNTEVVRLLLRNGASPKISLHDGMTAMQLAARYCMTEMMQDMLLAGASVDDASVPTRSPLILACKCHYERAEALHLLLDNGAKPNDVDDKGKTPLHIVCHQPSSGRHPNGNDDQFESVKALIDAGADVSRSYKGLDYNMIQYDVTPLGIAANRTSDRSKYRCLQALLDAGASPNAYGCDIGGIDYRLAIVAVCENGPDAETTGQHGMDDMNCTELLLDYGADLHYRDRNGMTLWHHAASGNNFHAAQTLFERGLDVNTKDVHGRTALHISCEDRWWMTTEEYKKWEDADMYSGSHEYASWHCSIESSYTILRLFAAGAMATAQDKHGCTPMHISAKAGNPRVLSMLLLYAGGNQIYDYPDSWGRLPFHHAANSVEATHVLLDWHLRRDIDSDRYYKVLEPPRHTIHSMANEFGGKIWDDVLKRRYREAHPDEIFNDDALTPPWRKNMINARDKLGNTPLHYAALIGNLDVVRKYLELPNIDLHIVNKDRESVLDFSLANRECALAIADKFSEVGIEISEDGMVGEHATRKYRGAAQRFIDGLRDEYKYGVYFRD